MKRRRHYILLLLLTFALRAPHAAPRAQTGNNLAPGAPGRDAQWTSAGKEAVGTSNTLDSKVWFTLRAGVLDEVYYPTVDVANTQTLQLAVVGCDGRVETEEADTNQRVEVVEARSLTFRQVNTAKSGAYTITKTYVTDPERHTLLVDVQVAWKPGGPCPCEAFVYYDPSLANSGMHDSAWTEGDALLASDADKSSALVADSGAADGFYDAVNGFAGAESDGLAQLRKGGRITHAYPRAADGNVVQGAFVRQPSGARPGGQQFTLALGFGREPAEALKNARASLAKGFARARAEYDRGWREYVGTLRRVGAKYQPQFDMAAMVLKAHEDKTWDPLESTCRHASLSIL